MPLPPAPDRVARAGRRGNDDVLLTSHCPLLPPLSHFLPSGAFITYTHHAPSTFTPRRTAQNAPAPGKMRPECIHVRTPKTPGTTWKSTDNADNAPEKRPFLYGHIGRRCNALGCAGACRPEEGMLRTDGRCVAHGRLALPGMTGVGVTWRRQEWAAWPVGGSTHARLRLAGAPLRGGPGCMGGRRGTWLAARRARPVRDGNGG
jgi:hypothetical protein